MTTFPSTILRTAAIAAVLGLCACSQSAPSNPGTPAAAPNAAATGAAPPCPEGADCPSDAEWKKLQAARAKNMGGWGARTNEAAAPDPGSVQFSYGADKNQPAKAATSR
ncbi:hypothetical protein XthCFBP4691_07785 [Xanthomonas theicola]|uniref:Uncharacterized protein n=2 Tax=Xanthomonas theicola TaxID=56464 RepID=A0A2S6ZGZ1_9XANT|nr:hypothetical protein XthCFBP4691_07785 [Xanthomonas theicola]